MSQKGHDTHTPEPPSIDVVIVQGGVDALRRWDIIELEGLRGIGLFIYEGYKNKYEKNYHYYFHMCPMMMWHFRGKQNIPSIFLLLICL